MIVCDACGATNRAEATVCRACGRALPGNGANEPPLPPIPDGGLATGMPAWLSAPLPTQTRQQPAPPDGATLAPATGQAPSDLYDPRTWLTEDDLPLWIRRLGEPRPVRGPAAQAGDGLAAPRSPRAAPASAPVRSDQPRAPAAATRDPLPPLRPTPEPRDVRPSLAVSLWLIAGVVVVAILVLVLLLIVSGGR